MQKMLARLLSAFVLFIFALNARASSDLWNWFHGSDIDYFNQGKRVKDPLKPEFKITKKVWDLKKGRLPIREYDKLPFDWADYEDPSSPVFFDDGGDYVMPRPYQIYAANPTKENAERVKRWQKRKMEATLVMDKLLREEDEASQNNIPWNRVGLYYFYSSTCSVCKEQSPVLSEIGKLGVDITTVQVDYKNNPALYSGSINYDENLKDAFPINVTPTFYVLANRNSKQWEGYTSLDQFKSKVSELFSSRL